MSPALSKPFPTHSHGKTSGPKSHPITPAKTPAVLLDLNRAACSGPTPSPLLPLYPERHQPSPRLSERPSLIGLHETCSPSPRLANQSSCFGSWRQSLPCTLGQLCPSLVLTILTVLLLQGRCLQHCELREDSVQPPLPLPAPCLSRRCVPITCTAPGSELTPSCYVFPGERKEPTL